MGELRGKSAPSPFYWCLTHEDAELEVGVNLVAVNRVIVSVGVPPGWISEEPTHAIVLRAGEARRVADALHLAANTADSRHE